MLRQTIRSSAPAWRAAARRQMSGVVTVTEESQYTAAIAKPGLTVAYYTAAWCSPCQRIAPIYSK